MELTELVAPSPNGLSLEGSPPQLQPTATPTVHDQNISPLFSALTADARLQLYKFLFGSRLVHVQYVPNPLQATKGKSSHRWRHCVCASRNQVAHYHMHEEKHDPCHVSGVILLRTCRRIHDEGLPILYASNTISFDCPGSLLGLQFKLQPARWNSIGLVDVCVFITHDWFRWNDTWALLGDLPGLQRARVRGRRNDDGRPKWIYPKGFENITEQERQARDSKAWVYPLLKWTSQAHVDVGFKDDLKGDLEGIREKLRAAGVLDRMTLFWITDADYATDDDSDDEPDYPPRKKALDIWEPMEGDEPEWRVRY
ncbi:hypothetical protein AK830_g5342 [Neonectria ditissima]|uniref:DUF7730 domain-containing protein n=1 Tax=Neonectria ditissima TaxID=78410 RepID=A0A0P7BM00_9HYPO|nr:hypothetical protein AK830_g5342 [Neonectria ditissima]